MVTMNLQKLFDPFWACIVENVEYDFRKSIVYLNFKEPENDTRHKIIFYGVTSLMWTMTGFEGQICQDVFPDLTSLELCNISVSSSDKWLRSYPLNFNIAIEIMDRALLINANAIELDNKFYYLRNCNSILDIGDM